MQESHEIRMNTQSNHKAGMHMEQGSEPRQPYVSGDLRLSVAPMMDGRYKV